MSQPMAEGWRNGQAKAFERGTAAMLPAQRRSFTTSFIVEQSPQEVFAAINNVRDWWTGDIEGNTTELGDEFTYRYEDIHRSTQKIIESIPDERVVWHVEDAYLSFADDKTEWIGTDIIFEIAPAARSHRGAIHARRLGSPVRVLRQLFERLGLLHQRKPPEPDHHRPRIGPIMSDLSDRTTVIVGASRGLGRGIAHAFAAAGAPVIAVARSGPALTELAATSANIRIEVADAVDDSVARRVLDRYDPEILVVVAGATPAMRPLREQTWDSFSVNWHADVKIAFTWLREALLKPLAPGSTIVVISSGAAIGGSPASGGYAGSKATQRFIAAYAQDEARRTGLDITVTAVMPKMTPLGDVGMAGVRSYCGT